jgi:hypothetical protein
VLTKQQQKTTQTLMTQHNPQQTHHQTAPTPHTP